MVASLWQSFPQKTNKEIFEAIEASGNNKDELNYNLGHGLPDFWKAYQILTSGDLEASSNQIDDVELAKMVGSLSNAGVIEIPILCKEKQLNKFQVVIKDQLGKVVHAHLDNGQNRNYSVIKLNADLNLDQCYSISIFTEEDVFVKGLNVVR